MAQHQRWFYCRHLTFPQGVYFRDANNQVYRASPILIMSPSGPRPSLLWDQQWLHCTLEKENSFWKMEAPKKEVGDVNILALINTPRRIAPSEAEASWTCPSFLLARSSAADTQPHGWFQYTATVSRTTLIRGHFSAAQFPGSFGSLGQAAGWVT